MALCFRSCEDEVKRTNAKGELLRIRPMTLCCGSIISQREIRTSEMMSYYMDTTIGSTGPYPLARPGVMKQGASSCCEEPWMPCRLQSTCCPPRACCPPWDESAIQEVPTGLEHYSTEGKSPDSDDRGVLQICRVPPRYLKNAFEQELFLQPLEAEASDGNQAAWR
ncbi:hypothetical protein ASZ78_009851 [Callipepla squamata]|uniref:Uncharacterized protein n=1 Tax=Callipepla squamata TaxID=9009 RepID=A0A226MST4_CALSU|nr:hypothetical protein ASZ78_009851 [Callipepla squamata]